MSEEVSKGNEFGFEGGRLKFYESRLENIKKNTTYFSGETTFQGMEALTQFLRSDENGAIQYAKQRAKEEAEQWQPRGPRKAQDSQLSQLQHQILEWLAREEAEAPATKTKTQLYWMARRGVDWEPKRFMKAFGLSVSSATISGSLARLEARGLVKLYKSGKLRPKTKCVLITKLGRSLLDVPVFTR